MGAKSIYIYAIPTTSEISGSDWRPIHTISRAPVFLRPCHPFIGKTSSTFVYLVGNDIAATEVPHNIDEKHSVIHIASFPNRYKTGRTFDLFNALDYQTNSGRHFLNTLRYPWDPLSDEGPRGVRVSSHTVNIPSNSFPLDPRYLSIHSFHASIGRLVSISPVEKQLHVYDLISGEELQG